MKLFIAIPSYKFINVEAVHCMFSLLSDDPENNRTLALHGGEGFVGRARNQICSKFLESDFDELLMIDSDIIYNPANVNRIASHNEPIVAAFYPKKAPGKTVWVANRTSTGGPLSTGADERGLVKVETIGTGFMKIQRKVLEKMRDSGLAARYIVDGTDIVEYEFFPFRVVNGSEKLAQNLIDLAYRVICERSGECGIDELPNEMQCMFDSVIKKTGKLRSEDWAFCDNAHELGFDVYGDTQCVVRHMGTCVYPLPEAKAIERLLSAIQKLKARDEYVPTEIFDALEVDPSYNVAS